MISCTDYLLFQCCYIEVITVDACGYIISNVWTWANDDMTQCLILYTNSQKPTFHANWKWLWDKICQDLQTCRWYRHTVFSHEQFPSIYNDLKLCLLWCDRCKQNQIQTARFTHYKVAFVVFLKAVVFAKFADYYWINASQNVSRLTSWNYQ